MNTVPKSEEFKPSNMTAFTFGDPEPVLSGHDYISMFETTRLGNYFEPPIPLSGLSKSFRSNPHHASSIYVKRNIIASCYEANEFLSMQDFRRLVLDFGVYGNGYLEIITNRFGRLLRLKPAPSLVIRRMITPDQYLMLTQNGDNHEFAPGSIIHIKEDDPNQEVYGVPEYLAGLQSALLNEAATLFRRKYYVNGSHAGFILYMTDAAQSQEDVDNLRTALKDAKGPGNFKNLFMYAPDGKENGLKVIPIAEVAAKDEFLNIKNITRDDVMAVHRVPPQLMGIVPNNTGGFGDVEKAAKVFSRNELQPLMNLFETINDVVGKTIIKFKKYEIE